MSTQKNRTDRLAWTIAAGAAAVVVLLVFVDPTRFPLFPRCPFHLLTGGNCPGCGTARAIRAAVTGRFRLAWDCNPALPFFLVALAVVSVRRSAAGSRAVAIVVGVAAVAWTVVRNVDPAFAIPSF